MLSSRIIKADIGNESTIVSAVTGCPQGGVLSPLLWSLVLDNLIVNLSDAGFYVLDFTDHLVLFRDKHESVISLA